MQDDVISAGIYALSLIAELTMSRDKAFNPTGAKIIRSFAEFIKSQIELIEENPAIPPNALLGVSTNGQN